MRPRGYQRAADAVRIRDFSDREILNVIADLTQGQQGEQVTTRELSVRLFGVRDTPANDEELRYLTKCVSSRLTWMRRYGLTDKGDVPGEWMLSPEGEAMRRSTLTAAAQRVIEQTEDIRLLELSHAIGERMLRARDTAYIAMRREFLFQSERRRRLSR